jgi:HK97 family phage major capsid protein
MSSADKSREQLKALRDRLAVKRGERTRLRQERDSARDAFAGADFSEAGSDITQTDEFRAAERTVAAVGAVEDEISGLEASEKLILQMLGSDEPGSTTPGGRGSLTPPANYGWHPGLVYESEAYQQAREGNLFQSGVRFGTVVLGEICDRDNFASFLRNPRLAAALPTAPAANVGTDQGAVRPDIRGIFPPALKPLTLLDLIPTGTTDSNIVQYVQVTGIPGYAAETAEGALKPQEGLTFNDASAPVRTIAGYAKMYRQAMDDMAGLSALVNQLLPYDVRRRMENQVLQGDGTGQNILGIMNTAGIGAPASVAGDNVMDGILRAITTCVLSDVDPDFIVLNPVSWQNMAILKASTAGTYLMEEPGGIEQWAGGITLPTAARTQSLWGLTVTRNRLIPQATPLVGDSQSATVLVREGVTVKTSDADQDDFIRNRVTVLAETRIAFPIWRPSGFAKAPLG